MYKVKLMDIYGFVEDRDHEYDLNRITIYLGTHSAFEEISDSDYHSLLTYVTNYNVNPDNQAKRKYLIIVTESQLQPTQAINEIIRKRKEEEDEKLKKIELDRIEREKTTKQREKEVEEKKLERKRKQLAKLQQELGTP